jgi:hypothetical protein
MTFGKRDFSNPTVSSIKEETFSGFGSDDPLFR